MKRWLTCMLLSITVDQVAANPADTGYQQGVQAAQDPALKLQDQAKIATQGESAINTAIGEGQVRYDATESQIYHDGRGNASFYGVNKQAKCATIQSSWTNAEKAECEAVNFAVNNPNQRPKYQLDAKTDPVLISSQNIKSTTNSGQNCRVVKKLIQAQSKTEHCLEVRAFTEKTCERRVSFSCDSYGGQSVSLGGVVKDSVTLKNHTGGTAVAIWKAPDTIELSLDTQRGTGTYYATAVFKIENLADLQEFKLTYGYWDQLTIIRLNGSEVLRLGGYYDSWGEVTRDTDLRQYLKEGDNVLEGEFWNGNGPGGGAVKIKTKLKTICTENWQDQCVHQGL